MGLITVKCPECQEKNKRGASFCRYCGAPLASKTTKCPNPSCRKRISLYSKHCPFCGTKTSADEKVYLQGNRWDKGDDQIAIKFSATLLKDISIDQGTQGMVIQEGDFKKELGPGKYKLSTLEKSFVGLSKKTDILLYDTRPMDFYFEEEGLIASNAQRVDVTLVYELTIKSIRDFNAFFMVNRASLIKKDVEAYLQPEIHSELRLLVQSTSPEDLVFSEVLRDAAGHILTEKVKPALEKAGLEFLRVITAEASAKDMGEVFELKRQLFSEKQRYEVIKQLKALDFEKFQDENQLKEAITQLEHENKIKDILREQEIDTLWKEFKHKEREKEFFQGLEMEHQKKLQEIEHKIKELELKDTSLKMWERHQREMKQIRGE